MNRSKRYLVLTNDSEIFGNGTGDVRTHIVEPNDAMASVCGEFGAPLTIFFEVEEYLAFQQFASALRRDLCYDPARLIREQIIRLARRGHDIQLHLHPEWYGARYSNTQWQINPDQTTVDSLFSSEAETSAYIATRKATIDEMLDAAGVSQRVRVYRAGAFSAQPGQNLLAALRSNGFVLDSSVCKGLTRRGVFDFRDAPCRKGPWRISSDVAVADPSGDLWEVPIYSEMGRRWQQATLARIRAKFSRTIPKARRDQMVQQLGINKTPLGVARFLLQAIPIKLDYHNVSPLKLVRMIDGAPVPTTGAPDVVVLIGHSKEHLSDEPLRRFLRLVASRSDLKIVGFDYIAGLLANKAPTVATVN